MFTYELEIEFEEDTNLVSGAFVMQNKLFKKSYLSLASTRG